MRSFKSDSKTYGTQEAADLLEHDDALLRAPVGGNVKHPGAVALGDPVYHLGVLTDVGVYGPDDPHHRAQLVGLRNSELVQSCGQKKHAFKTCHENKNLVKQSKVVEVFIEKAKKNK